MSAMSPADFEALYQRQSDPWSYTTSAYERDKYAATLAACGAGPFDSALELGASIGVFTARLAPRCRSLVTVDAAPTAVARARERLAGAPGAERVETVVGAIPHDIPRRRYDLVVASEILYYLSPSDLEATLEVIGAGTGSGARVVAVHWRPPGPERPFDAEAVHARLRAAPWATPVSAAPTEDYLLDVVERR